MTKLNLKEIFTNNVTNSWVDLLIEEFDKPYMKDLQASLQSKLDKGITIYPNINNIFNAFKLTSPEKVKCVILGQDPYITEGVPHGLSFSSAKHFCPPSLRKVYGELKQEYGTKMPAKFDLTSWANQGVLLLNTVLTVDAGVSFTHKNFGWQTFVGIALNKLEKSTTTPKVYLLWGKAAQNFIVDQSVILGESSLSLKTSHPAARGVYNTFKGCGHFKSTNNFLSKNNLPTIDWFDL